MTQTPKPDTATSYHRSKTPIETSARALQILHAADELLAERGPDHVSMRDIAERAGVNKALIFYYFGSRTQLFEKVLERYYRNHAKALANAFTGGGSPRERVRRAIDAYLDFMDQNHLFSRLVMQEVARHDDGTLPQIRANLHQLYELMREEFKDLLPDDGPLSPKHFFVTLSATVINYYTYARVLGTAIWGMDPTAPQALQERRDHVQWLAQAVIDRVVAERLR
ncbi:MAG: TetR/AcrR family transcriptional regulator [Myxococcota bacterium]